jgi:hypothetical protein
MSFQVPAWRRKELFEKSVRGNVGDHDEKQQAYRNMNRGGSPGVMKEGIGEREVQILLCIDKAGEDEDEKRYRRLEHQTSSVVSPSVERPEKHCRQDEMVKRKKPDPQGESHVKEVFRATDQMAPGEHSTGYIQDPSSVDHKRRNCLARNQQTIIKQ